MPNLLILIGLPSLNMKMYAADTVIYASGNTTLEVQSTLQSCLDYVYNWCITNRHEHEKDEDYVV